MSATDVDENDPEVQRNGFELYADTWNIKDEVLEEFLEDEFVPSDTWRANHTRWWSFFTRQIPRCPDCGAKVHGAEPLDTEGEVPELLLDPCGDTIQPASIER